MSAEAAHRTRADENSDLSERLASEAEFRWAIIVAFYSAVHYAGALLANEGDDTDLFDSHRAREDLLFSRHYAIERDYRNLKNQSNKARYVPDSLSDADAYRRAVRRLDRVRRFYLDTRTEVG